MIYIITDWLKHLHQRTSGTSDEIALELLSLRESEDPVSSLLAACKASSAFTKSSRVTPCRQPAEHKSDTWPAVHYNLWSAHKAGHKIHDTSAFLFIF